MIPASVQAMAEELGVPIRGQDDMSDFLRIADALRERGYIVLMKWDGERDTSPCTAMVSCAPAPSDEGSFRRDHNAMERALNDVFVLLAERGL